MDARDQRRDDDGDAIQVLRFGRKRNNSMSTGFPHAQEIVKNSNAEVRVRPGPLHPPPCSRRPRVPHLGGSGRRGPEKGLSGILTRVFPH